MKPTIIREHVMRLHLDPDAKFPHELLRDEAKAQSAREEIIKFRESQRLHLVVDEPPEVEQ